MLENNVVRYFHVVRLGGRANSINVLYKLVVFCYGNAYTVKRRNR